MLSIDDLSDFLSMPLISVPNDSPDGATTMHGMQRQPPKTKLKAYESIDYWGSHSMAYRLSLSKRAAQPRWLKWFIFALVGLAVGVWAVVFYQSLDCLEDLKSKLLTAALRDSLESNPTFTAAGGISIVAALRGGAVHVAISTALAALAALLCCLCPAAAGSGVPEVMSYLNGLRVPSLFGSQVLFAKSASCIFAVGSGMPVGAEGPTIHVGALIGSEFPKLYKLRGFKWLGGALRIFSAPSDDRDFTTAGAAAGVTAAFHSPIGGLLFVMEEIASFFSVKLAWMVFSTCLVSLAVIQLSSSFLIGWTIVDRDGLETGSFLNQSTALFGTETSSVSSSQIIYASAPVLFIAVFMGIFAAVFIKGNVAIRRLRKHYAHSRRSKVAEVVLFAALYSSLAFFITLPFGCYKKPKALVDTDEWPVHLVTSMCNTDGEYHPLASLMLTSTANAIRLLYNETSSSLFPWHALIIFLCIYTAGAMHACGIFVSSGIIFPTLVIGAAGGRLVGAALVHVSWSNSGFLAKMGSAAFLGGVSRLTFSVAVIMMEMTNDLQYIVYLLGATLTAKLVADCFTHSLYHQVLVAQEVPFMSASFNEQVIRSRFVHEFMKAPATTVRTTEPVRNILATLQLPYRHFPVVSISDNHTMRGSISRCELIALLSFALDWTQGVKNTSWSGPTFDELRDRSRSAGLEETLSSIRISPLSSHSGLFMDLNAYCDTATVSVRADTCVLRSQQLFMQMGLGHLPVVDHRNWVVGMLTRTDFFMCSRRTRGH